MIVPLSWEFVDLRVKGRWVHGQTGSIDEDDKFAVADEGLTHEVIVPTNFSCVAIEWFGQQLRASS